MSISTVGQVTQNIGNIASQIATPFTFPVNSLTKNLFSDQAFQIVEEIAGNQISGYLSYTSAAVGKMVTDVASEVEGAINWSALESEACAHALEFLQKTPHYTPQIEQLVRSDVSTWIQMCKQINTKIARFEQNPMAGMRFFENFSRRLEREVGREGAMKILDAMEYDGSFGVPTTQGIDLLLRGERAFVELMLGQSRRFRPNFAQMVLADYLESAIEATSDMGVLTDPACWGQVQTFIEGWVGRGTIDPQLFEVFQRIAERCPEWFTP